MATEVTLPALGESVTEGTVTRWLKQVGDSVAVDEPLLEVSTDKVDTEIPSPVAGTLLEIKANEDDTVEVGAVLAILGDEGESTGGGESQDQSGGEEQEQAPAEEPAEEPEQAKAEEPAAAQEPAPAGEEAEKPAAETKPAGGGGTSVTLPALGESVTEGTVTRWLKQVGDDVAVDEPLLEVSTDKVDTEIPSPVAGTLLEIKVAEDETVEVGAELAVVGDGSAAPAQEEQAAPQQEQAAEPEPEPEPAPEPEQKQPEPEPAPAAQPAAPAPAPRPPQHRPQRPAAPAGGDGDATYVTPLVRKLATQHGVDLGTVTGTGVGGRIRKQDVLDAAKAKEAPAPAAAPAASAPAAPAAGCAADAVAAARHDREDEPAAQGHRHPHGRVAPGRRPADHGGRGRRDRDRAAARLGQGRLPAREGVKLTFLPFFAKAAIDALKQHPYAQRRDRHRERAR